MEKKLNLTEFNKLEQLLKDAGIRYEREDSPEDDIFEHHQLRHPEPIGAGSDQRWLWDVVISDMSYGRTVGLLEMWGKGMKNPAGYQNAKMCLDMIKEILEADVTER